MKKITWHKVLDHKKDLAENRVMTVDAGAVISTLGALNGWNSFL